MMHRLLRSLICSSAPLLVLSLSAQEKAPAPFGMEFGAEFSSHQAIAEGTSRLGYHVYPINPVAGNTHLQTYTVYCSGTTNTVFRVGGFSRFEDKDVLGRVHDALLEELDQQYGRRTPDSRPALTQYASETQVITVAMDEEAGTLEFLCTHLAWSRVAWDEKWPEAESR